MDWFMYVRDLHHERVKDGTFIFKNDCVIFLGFLNVDVKPDHISRKRRVFFKLHYKTKPPK